MRKTARSVVPGCLLLALAVIGCGGGARAYPVDGKVEYSDGKPATDLKGFKVEFEWLDKLDGKGVSAEGEIDAGGKFTMTTFKANDGALPGKHWVLIAPPVPVGDTPQKPYKIAHRYISYETSGLTAVVETKATPVTLVIERR